MKEFLKAFTQFVTRNGWAMDKVFDDFLQYIIWLHTMPEYGKRIECWSYTAEESKEMFDLYRTLVVDIKPLIDRNGWFDAFGEIYEDLVVGKFHRDNSGQFFTPPSICDLMRDIIAPKDTKVVEKIISDPTCGSGRNLLSFHSAHVGNYYVAEDVDRTCVMMTVCNFILHGVEGEVIWHNTLNPDTFYGAYRTNEQLNSPPQKYYGIPHVREIQYEDTKLKHINDKSAEVFRIKGKLQKSYEKQITTLRELRTNNLTADEIKRQERQITIKISNIKKLIKRYER